MFKARVERLRCYWLVGTFLLYVKSVESQQPPQAPPAPPVQNPMSGKPVPLRHVFASREYMRYCDHRWPVFDIDEFANRIVYINKRNFVYGEWTTESQIIAPGVFIDRNHVLTSYTPFRRLASIEKHRNLAEFYITYYKAKWLNQHLRLQGYVLDFLNVTCGRQVFPNVSSDFEQSENFLHIPKFDLMVLKTDPMVNFINHSFLVQDAYNKRGYLVVGPQVTDLVYSNASIKTTLKFVSLGMLDWNHVYNRNHLHTVNLETKTRLIEDCEEWFDEANDFICIKNIHEHIAIGSGALLFSEELLIGVASFTMNKGHQSIHAFTDVRKLLQLINTTCTEFDGFPDQEWETSTLPPTTTPKGQMG